MRTTTGKIVLAIPFAAALLALGACDKAAEPEAQQPETPLAAQPQESAAPGAQSSEWVQEPASPEGVKVNLPDTPMTNPPAEEAAPAKQPG